MTDFAIFWEWLSFAVRWTHVITAIAWICASFYFIALDLGLRKTPSLPPLAHGEEWQVHGGGFYHIQKYLVAPEMMPEHMNWFNRDSYATWLSGFMLLVVYYFGADLPSTCSTCRAGWPSSSHWGRSSSAGTPTISCAGRRSASRSPG
jgi:uncharacterized membrane protein